MLKSLFGLVYRMKKSFSFKDVISINPFGLGETSSKVSYLNVQGTT